MNSPVKINFGNTGNSYSVNNNYASLSSNDVPQNSLNYATTNLLPSYRQGSYQTYNPPVTTTKNYVVTDINHPAPVTKVTFGNKQFVQTYTPKVQSSYRPPQPVLYQPPIKQQVRVQQKVQAPVVNAPNVTTPTVNGSVKKTSGCPTWLWALLGVLALIGLILALLFGLGVFGGKGQAPATGAAANGGFNAGDYTTVTQQIVLSKTPTNANGNTSTNGGSNTNTNGGSSINTNGGSNTNINGGSSTNANGGTNTNVNGGSSTNSNGGYIQPNVIPTPIGTTQPTVVYNYSTQPTVAYTQPSVAYTQPTATYIQPTVDYIQPTAVRA